MENINKMTEQELIEEETERYKWMLFSEETVDRALDDDAISMEQALINSSEAHVKLAEIRQEFRSRGMKIPYREVRIL
jgi:hypothetical protein